MFLGGVEFAPLASTLVAIAPKFIALTLAMEASQRQKAQEALRQSEAKFHKLTTHMPGMIYQFVLHPDGAVNFP
ncbi:hypothetical protein CI593_13860 [Fischerella thermalis CCMEE 5194]|nr:hypothetical protein CI593_13860 [Fischerella thermalis CCMEE 5194]